MSSKVAIVTDSTAGIPANLMEGLPIYTLPLQVIWGETIYQDGIDITPAEFYQALANAKVMPSTSQVTPIAFIKLYEQLLSEGYEILNILISAKLSGTIDSATQAKAHFPGATIEIFDSKAASMALGFQVLYAARMVKDGASLKEVLQAIEKLPEKSGATFVVDTLEFLHRGGRIGGAAAFLGNAFDLKPILELRDGRIEAAEKVRTKKKAILRTIQLVQRKLDGYEKVHLACLNANAPTEAQMLLDEVCKTLSDQCIFETVAADVSPVIGTHTGPGTVGLAYMFE
jgi:DegV family protein with EDD domain